MVTINWYRGWVLSCFVPFSKRSTEDCWSPCHVNLPTSEPKVIPGPPGKKKYASDRCPGKFLRFWPKDLCLGTSGAQVWHMVPPQSPPHPEQWRQYIIYFTKWKGESNRNSTNGLAGRILRMCLWIWILVGQFGWQDAGLPLVSRIPRGQDTNKFISGGSADVCAFRLYAGSTCAI